MRSVGHGIGSVVMTACVLLVSGCGAQATATPDPALAQFINGAWTYEGDYEYRGDTLTGVYRNYSFEAGNVVWISTGETGSQCTYQFAGADVLRVKCEPDQYDARALSVKRDGESLLIQELDDRLSPLGEQLRFTRVAGG